MDSSRIGRRAVLGAAGLALTPELVFAQRMPPKVRIKTSRGDIVVELENRKAPLTSANFLRYVDNKLYDGGNIYRAMKTEDLPDWGTIQGQPPGTTRRYPPVAHESSEKTGLIHDTGTISLARFGPNTATADFYICLNPMPYLDAHPEKKGDNQGYAVFGHVIDGMEVVKTIHGLETKGKAAFKELQGQILTKPIPIISMRRTA